MNKTTEERMKEIYQEMSQKVDWNNHSQLANDIWLFLTNDDMPNSATIKKEAFLHEVTAMLNSVAAINQSTNTQVTTICAKELRGEAGCKEMDKFLSATVTLLNPFPSPPVNDNR